MSTPIPPDDAETRVVPAPPAAGPLAGPAPVDPATEYEPEPSRGLGWGMLLGVLVLIAVAAAIAAVYFATRNNDDSNAAQTTTAPLTTTAVAVVAAKMFVPDVSGLEQDAAVARLAKAHLTPVITYKPTKKPSGLVVSQEPKAAERVARGTNVTLVVDKGSPNVAVPDVTNLKVADANTKLQAAGFKAQTTPVTAAGKAPGTVVSQAPAAGDKVAKGALITLSIAKAAPAPTTTAEATTTTAATTAPAATTTPKATTTAKTTTTAAPTTATVPDLSGTDVQAASQALIGANLLATIAYVPGTDPLGTVVSQAPASGGTAKAMSHVTVNASSGPNAKEQATVPNAVGQQLEQAVSTMNGAGLRLIFVKEPVTTRASVGKVIEQSPLAGKTAPKNAQVLVVIGVLRQG
jgi:beta-lactam-binding protein with PASTA domain